MLKIWIIATMLIAINGYSGATFVVGNHNREIIIIPDENTNDAPSLIKTKIGELSALGGGVLRLSAGRYNVPNSYRAIEITSKNNVKIIGEGKSTEFISESDQTDAIFYFSGCSKISIENIYFQGFVLPSSNWGNNSTYHAAIQITGSTHMSINDNFFKGFYTGGVLVQGSSSNSIHIMNNHFDDVSYKKVGDYGAVSIENANDIHIINNIMKGITHSGISGTNANKLTISENTIYLNESSNYSMGMYFIEGISNSVITSNRIFNSNNEGIVLDGDGSSIVKHNIISNNIMTVDYTGITVNLYASSPDSYDNLISNNHISAWGSHEVNHGILTFRSRDNSFISNIILNTDKGINLQQSPSNNTVSSNKIDAVSDGIVLFGTSVAIGNKIHNANRGIYCNYSSKSIINSNYTTNVNIPYSEGTSGSGCHDSENY